MRVNVLTKSLLALVLVPMLVFAQGTIQGTVSDAGSGAKLPGANVLVDGTTLGAASDAQGFYSISGVPAGQVSVTVMFIGYENFSATVNVRNGQSSTLNVLLERSALELNALEVMASRATRETPVAYTDVVKEDMEMRLASQDIPMVLNTTPSVYATAQGGGAGDARINVRGFDQRNIAIMINGVPVNDMENGWVYWSNWDGVGDATSSIQVQRGLSAVNLATPSVGGTMNIITDPAAHDRGGMLKQEIGNDAFLKSTLSFHSGLIGDKLALSGTVVRKSGDGFYQGTYTDAWAYYFGASYALNTKNRLEFYAVGAPQLHGQNLYKQNTAVYDQEFAKEIFSDEVLALDSDGNGTADVFDKFSEEGRDYNQNYNSYDGDYSGPVYYEMYSLKNGVDAPTAGDGYFMERENYYHKPQVNVNWFSTLSDKMRLYTTVYYSGGMGGGTGTYGSVNWDYSLATRRIDWESTIMENDTTVDASYSATENKSVGILRNSVNQQWTIGAISKLNYDLSDNLKTQFGIDWRTAEIGHWREVRDLLGGDYYVDSSNDFDLTNADKMKRIGDKIAYYNHNTVDWLGAFAQAEFSTEKFTAYGMYGFSNMSYHYVDHFTEVNGEEMTADATGLTGFQAKGGGLFNISQNLNVFANVGYVSKAPIFDNAINDGDGTVYEDPENEKFQSVEFGTNAYLGNVALKANYYNTNWMDRSNVRGIDLPNGSEAYVYLRGMDVNHSGIELEASIQPMQMLRLDASVSLGDWKYLNDVDGTYKLIEEGVDTTIEYTYFVKDLKVGNQPQKAYAFIATLMPVKGMNIQAVYRYYMDNYSDWDAFSRTDAGDTGQSWKAPDYGIMDLHAAYNLPVQLGPVKLKAFLNVLNALDAVYVLDAVDNSSFNAFTADGKNHEADDAEVYLGMPRSINAGLQINF